MKTNKKIASKVPKKAVANLLREGANKIEKYGHTKRDFGNTYKGFCALGSMRDGFQNKATYGDSYAEYIAAARALGSYCEANKLFEGSIIAYNDDPSTNSKQIVKVMRRTAAAVEHGLKFDQKVETNL